ncbi:DUF4397 domain-containing protein [Flavobacterium beibuense]|uniref:T9SS type A sorting domain-containing protein n=1 Tax=Flavobacterium beibuense TaxID=657326 RepID=UPI00101D2422|nr:DUF4397 domain-containing protein [Flavobacterium beibuense]
MKKTTHFLTAFLLLVLNCVTAQTARVQVIHNCADLAAQTVDVYLNGTILLDDFAFRTATPFVDAPASEAISIVVAPGDSSSAADGIYTLNTTLTENETYILVANGIVSSTGYSPNQPFELSVFSGARETALSAGTDILVNHGATDAPAVDAVETSVPAGTVVNDLSYPSFSSGYLELATADYTLDVTDQTGMTVVASYQVPLASLNLEGAALTVLASGFLDPSMNSEGPAFGLWVATAEGGDLIELPLANQTARVQVLHNAADLAAQTVDVYLNETLLLDDFAFRTASPFVDAPAGEEITLSIAPSTSNSVEDNIFSVNVTLEANEKYIVVANGIVSDSGYSPSQPFGLFVYPMARETATMETNTDILVFHGATDAPTVDVQAVGAGTIVDDLQYSNFNDYLELPTADYIISIATADGETIVASYQAPLSTLDLEGQSLTVLASGFLDPSANSDGPSFGLWAATSAGGAMLELPLTTLNTNEFETKRISVYPNPAADNITITGYDFTANLTHRVYDAFGRQVVNTTGNTIDVSGLSEGIYIVKSTNGSTTSEQKIIVKR